MKHVAESDWKLFRSRIAGWQEAHMSRLNHEYIELLSADGAASEKFWALDKRIREDRRSVGVVIEMKRSVLHANIWRLLGEGVIGFEDLDGFSDELVGSLKANWPAGSDLDISDGEMGSNV